MVSVIAIALIFLFLLREGAAVFKAVRPLEFILGLNWYPVSEHPQYGILPLVAGSFLVTAGALVIVVPLGLAVAVYTAYVAPPLVREILKPTVELLAAIPSVVIGFLGMVVLTPWIKALFGLPTGFTALTGSIVLAFMALPTVASIGEDALTSLPADYTDASLALGASRLETIVHVLLPAARSGIVAAAMLGMGRIVGETMAVMMVTGNAAQIPTSLLQPVRTLTATIAAEMGETVRYSEHYHALFAIGIVLFAITFAINLVADLVLHRKGWR